MNNARKLLLALTVVSFVLGALTVSAPARAERVATCAPNCPANCIRDCKLTQVHKGKLCLWAYYCAENGGGCVYDCPVN